MARRCDGTGQGGRRRLPLQRHGHPKRQLPHLASVHHVPERHPGSARIFLRRPCLPFPPVYSLQNPESFDPSRWEPGSPDLPTLSEMFVPFSVGKRVCPGQNLALFEIKMTLCHLYRYFEFEMLDKGEIQTEFFFTLKPTNTDMRVRRRQAVVSY